MNLAWMILAALQVSAARSDLPHFGAKFILCAASALGFSGKKGVIMHSIGLMRCLGALGLFVLALGGLASPAFAATLNVPGQYTTIQAAINASNDGDTVLVADGTYTGPGDVDIDFSGKNITVMSQNGPASTIIDCQASAATLSSRGFIIHSGELNATISGFTVKNGYQVQNNSGVTSGSGGGIYVGSTTAGSSLTVSNCIITHCVVDSGFIGGVGGGIYAQTNSAGAASAITITNCTITNNTAVFSGGGIENSAAGNATITMTGCTITGNTTMDPYGSNAIGKGGGVYNSTDSLLTAPGSGAITVSACTIANNTADYAGGGVYNVNNTYGTITVNNCTLTGNSAGTFGGGINSYGGTQIVTNCSFTGNSGGGLTPSCVLTLNNDIFYGDTGGEIGTSTQPLELRNCDVQGGLPAGATDGGGNIDADPLFVNAPSDLHLQAGSPCVGAGLLIAGVLTDKDGSTRPNPPSIGAYEGPAAVILAATTTTLTSSLNPSPIGKPVTLSVTVSNATQTVPTGTVQISYNGASLGSGMVDAGGKINFTITGLTAAGSYPFTATYSGDANNQGSSATLTQTVSVTGPTHVLWHNTQDGRTALWTVAADGTVTGHAFGPYPGWTSRFLADGPDGLARLLWSNTDGRIAVWTIAADGTPTAVTYGPLTGWTPLGLAVGPDSHVHVLWNHTADNLMALWDIAPGAAPVGTAYGPYSGYKAGKLAVSPDNHVHVLWTVQNGIALWDIAPGASPIGYPYTVPASYTPLALSAGPDNHVHVLWNHAPDSQIALWDIAPGAAPTGMAFGPYSGYTASSLAVGTDSHLHVLWTVGTGGSTIWDLAPGLAPTGVLYNPGAGWSAIGVSAAP